MQTVSATDIKNRFGEYIEISRDGPVQVNRTGRPVAVLMSWKDYERMSALEDAYWGMMALQAEKSGYLSAEDTAKFLEKGLK